MERAAEDLDNNPAQTRLAVIFAVRGRLSNVQKTLDCLITQTAADRIDLVVSANTPALLQEVEEYVLSRGVLANPRFLLHQTPELATARLLAAKQVSAEILTLAEDHCFPEANFAEELLGVFDSSAEILAAAPVIHNPNPGSAVSRAYFLLAHGILNPAPGSCRTEEAAGLPWHNTTYRRAAFLAAAREVGLVQAEGLLQAEIRRHHPDARFVHCHHTVLRHVNISKLVPAFRHAFHGGRIFGAERAKYTRWGWVTRLQRVVLFPLVALLKMLRCASLLLDRASFSRTLTNIATACLLALAHALGEATGIASGIGKSATYYTDLDYDRARFLNPAERHLLFSDSFPCQQATRPIPEHAD